MGHGAYGRLCLSPARKQRPEWGTAHKIGVVTAVYFSAQFQKSRYRTIYPAGKGQAEDEEDLDEDEFKQAKHFG